MLSPAESMISIDERGEEESQEMKRRGLLMKIVLIASVVAVSVGALSQKIRTEGTTSVGIMQRNERAGAKLERGYDRPQADQPIRNVEATSDIYKGEDINAQWGLFPNHVKLNGFDCGGVLVSAKKVLTAGHCCKTQKLPIKVGTSKGETIEGDPEVIGEYNYPSASLVVQSSPINDICVITLRESSAIDSFPLVKELDLKYKTETEAGTQLKIVGTGYYGAWGASWALTPEQRQGVDDDHLRTATVPLICCNCETTVPNPFENKSNKAALTDEAEKKNLICTGPGQNDEGPCAGDSGGGLYSLDKKEVYGVLDDIWKRVCSKGPAYWTNLKNYEKFLSDNGVQVAA